jgi:hypothetical protein
MSKQWRCRCPIAERDVEFTVEKGKPVVCPSCGADASDPRFKGMLFELATIHFDPPHRIPGFGMGHRACDPTIKLPDKHNSKYTGEPGAVTCRACKATPAWKDSAEKWGIPVVLADEDLVLRAEGRKVVAEDVKATQERPPVVDVPYAVARPADEAPALTAPMAAGEPAAADDPAI